MIRTAENSDRNQIASIWKTCFGDEDGYIRFFLENGYRPERCLLQVVDGTPVAMLHLLPAVYYNGNGKQMTQYIYAAATLPRYQRRGLMAELIDFAVNLGQQKGLLFTSLLPASGSLYSYYKKLGFHTAFFLKRVRVSREKLLARTAGAEPAVPVQFELERIAGQRTALFEPAILWEKPMLAYITEEWKFTGGKILSFSEGYLFVKRINNSLFVKELGVKEADFPSAAAFLLHAYDCPDFYFHLPAESALFRGEIVPGGMLCFSGRLNDSGLTDEIKAYFNMMLD